MNWLDVLLLIVAALAVFWGLKNGLIGSALTIMSILVGLFLAPRISEPIAERLTDTVGSASIANTVAYGLVFLGIVIAAQIVAFILRGIVRAVFLGWADRIGGAVIGLISGILLGFAVIAIFARLAYLFPDNAPSTAPLLPIETRSAIEPSLLGSALVPQYLKLRAFLPEQPGAFDLALDTLERRRADAGAEV